MDRYIVLLIILLGMTLYSAGCGGSGGGEERGDSGLRISVAVPPVEFIAEKITGDKAEVVSLLKKGQDPHTFSPSPSEVKTLYSSDIYLMTGLPFEQGIKKRLSGKQGIIINDISEGVEKRRMHAGHEKKDENRDEHGMHDPHIWLGVKELKRISNNILKCVQKADTLNSKYYLENYERFVSEVDSVHQVVKERLSRFSGRSFYVFHPSFGYFADDYGLRQHALEVEGKSPSAKEIRNLLKDRNKESVSQVYISPQFEKRSMDVVARAFEADIEVLDPLKKDILRNLDEISRKLESGFSVKPDTVKINQEQEE